jgi:hypothetical protein
MKKNVLGDVFGYKPQNTPEPLPAPAAPAPVATPPKHNREIVSPEVAAQTQAKVWGNGNVPPPKAPTAKQADMGQAPAMNNQEGWGKI